MMNKTDVVQEQNQARLIWTNTWVTVLDLSKHFYAEVRSEMRASWKDSC